MTLSQPRADFICPVYNTHIPDYKRVELFD